MGHCRLSVFGVFLHGFNKIKQNKTEQYRNKQPVRISFSGVLIAEFHDYNRVLPTVLTQFYRL